MTDEERLRRVNELFPYIREYQNLAQKEFQIEDIFQDNGGKLMQVLLVTKLKNLAESREGNDAVAPSGKEYELKSVNIELTKSFSTNHHINQRIIDKYRKVDWIFAVYRDIELIEIYRMTPAQLEPYYKKWETQCIEQEKELNNPKVPLKYVQTEGELIYHNKKGEDLHFSKSL
jgi:hypothetical protein